MPTQVSPNVLGIASRVRPVVERRDSRAYQALLTIIDRETWIERQRERGRLGGILSGRVRRERTADIDAAICRARRAGMSQRQIAQALGVTRTKVRWVIARDGEGCEGTDG